MWQLDVKGIIQTVVIAIIVVCAIMIPFSTSLYDSAKATAQDNSQKNCQITARSRPQGNARAFVTREILLIAQAAYDSFPPRFRASEDRQVQKDAQREATSAPGQGLEKVQNFSDLEGLVTDLPLLTCNQFKKG